MNGMSLGKAAPPLNAQLFPRHGICREHDDLEGVCLRTPTLLTLSLFEPAFRWRVNCVTRQRAWDLLVYSPCWHNDWTGQVGGCGSVCVTLCPHGCWMLFKEDMLYLLSGCVSICLLAYPPHPSIQMYWCTGHSGYHHPANVMQQVISFPQQPHLKAFLSARGLARARGLPEQRHRVRFVCVGGCVFE